MRDKCAKCGGNATNAVAIIDSLRVVSHIYRHDYMPMGEYSNKPYAKENTDGSVAESFALCHSCLLNVRAYIGKPAPILYKPGEPTDEYDSEYTPDSSQYVKLLWQ
jgi:hypothetical protein